MPIKEKVIITQQDIILYEIMRHPILCGEFIHNVDLDEYMEPFEFTSYQREFMGDFNAYVALCCGRAVGKTESLVFILIWLIINNIFPGDYVVYTVPNKVHLEPVWARITLFFRTNSFLKNWLQPKRGVNSSEHTIKLLNGAQLLCRIAGTSGTGTNVIGLHTPFEIVDEGGYYPWGTWQELQPTLNTWTEGYRQIVSGVPTGLREQNVLYYADEVSSIFTKHRITAHENPRYTSEDEIRNKQQYGGEESDDYIHFVLGRHGKPTFAVFDRTLFNIGTYPVWKLTINGLKLKDNLADYLERLALFPGLRNKKHDVIFGIDLGYTDPSAIVVLYIDKGIFKFHGRIQLNRVPYPIQAKIIDYLDTKFNPVLIGVDEGHAGKAEIQRMHLDEEYQGKNYKQRMIPIDFNSNVSLGFDADGDEIKSRTKPFSISVLQDYSNNHRIEYSSTDLELITELERMTYTKSPTGNIIYKTLTPKGGQRGADHFTAAMLCAAMAYYLENEAIVPNRQVTQLFMPKYAWNQ
jgi:hypothetical protein